MPVCDVAGGGVSPVASALWDQVWKAQLPSGLDPFVQVLAQHDVGMCAGEWWVSLGLLLRDRAAAEEAILQYQDSGAGSPGRSCSLWCF